MHLLVLRVYVLIQPPSSATLTSPAIRTTHISTVGKVLGLSTQEKSKTPLPLLPSHTIHPKLTSLPSRRILPHLRSRQPPYVPFSFPIPRPVPATNRHHHPILTNHTLPDPPSSSAHISSHPSVQANLDPSVKAANRHVPSHALLKARLSQVQQERLNAAHARAVARAAKKGRPPPKKEDVYYDHWCVPSRPPPLLKLHVAMSARIHHHGTGNRKRIWN